MSKLTRYGLLQLKFNELTTKYASLVKAYENEPTKSNIYQDMLEDLQELESICIARRRY